MKFPVAKAGTIRAVKNNAGILTEKKKKKQPYNWMQLFTVYKF